eukprot:5974292-Amphidinium_carterae.1
MVSYYSCNSRRSALLPHLRAAVSAILLNLAPGLQGAKSSPDDSRWDGIVNPRTSWTSPETPIA